MHMVQCNVPHINNEQYFFLKFHLLVFCLLNCEYYLLNSSNQRKINWLLKTNKKKVFYHNSHVCRGHAKEKKYMELRQ